MSVLTYWLWLYSPFFPSRSAPSPSPCKDPHLCLFLKYRPSSCSSWAISPSHKTDSIALSLAPDPGHPFLAGPWPQKIHQVQNFIPTFLPQTCVSSVFPNLWIEAQINVLPWLPPLSHPCKWWGPECPCLYPLVLPAPLALILCVRTAPVTWRVSPSSITIPYTQKWFLGGTESDHDSFLLKTCFTGKSKSMINTNMLPLWNGAELFAFYSMYFFTICFFLTRK